MKSLLFSNLVLLIIVMYCEGECEYSTKCLWASDRSDRESRLVCIIQNTHRNTLKIH